MEKLPTGISATIKDGDSCIPPLTKMLNLLISAALGIALFGYLPGVDAVAGVTTFNDYTTQSGVACAGFSPVNSQGGGIFSAAMADLSPLWVGSRCTGSMNALTATATEPALIVLAVEYFPRELFALIQLDVGKASCRTGSLDGETSGACSGATIKVKIIDACPATHPANYCKIASVISPAAELD
ncbi:hypothetical protein K438DRAFT_1976062 [Mycena galopus ATCC 62051]|nr:hypothetical protein K438DRAFT_1976062 [Mycena galopus ATCC 62051]